MVWVSLKNVPGASICHFLFFSLSLATRVERTEQPVNNKNRFKSAARRMRHLLCLKGRTELTVKTLKSLERCQATSGEMPFWCESRPERPSGN